MSDIAKCPHCQKYIDVFSNPTTCPKCGNNIAGYNFPDESDVSIGLDKANHDIQGAYSVGLISGVFTCVFLLIGLGTGMDSTSMIGIVFTVAVIFGLSYGIYMKSRVCAVLLLVLFVIDKLVTLWDAGGKQRFVLILWVIFAYYLYKGIRGTFSYHRLMKA